MINFSEFLPKDLYQSYIIECNPETTIKQLQMFLERKGYIDIGSPDLLCQNYDTFSIEDGRELKRRHSEKKVTNKKRVFILGIKFINHEAERTLLKILEEPSPNTHFFIMIPNALMLLDTIRSRAHIIKINDNNIINDNAKEFLLFKLKERLDYVSEIIKESNNDENSGIIRFKATSLINELEKIYYEEFKKDKNNTETQYLLGELEKSRDYLSLPGASVKMILEHIALVV